MDKKQRLEIQVTIGISVQVQESIGEDIWQRRLTEEGFLQTGTEGEGPGGWLDFG